MTSIIRMSLSGTLSIDPGFGSRLLEIIQFLRLSEHSLSHFANCEFLNNLNLITFFEFVVNPV